MEPRKVFHPSFGRVINVQRIEQPETDDAITAHTISYMSRFVIADSQAEPIRQALHDAVRTTSADDEVIASVFQWVKEHVRFEADAKTAEPFAHMFSADEADPEVLIRPVDLLAMRDVAEDCDGFSMLTAAMMRAAGFDVAFRAVAAHPLYPGVFSHVYVVAFTRDGRAVPMDTSHGPRAGWEVGQVRQVTKTRTFPIGRRAGLRGLGVDFDLNNVIDRGFDFATQRWGTPSGGYYERDANGSVRQGVGAPVTFPSTGGSSLLIPGMLLLVAVMVMSGGNK